MAYTKTNWLDRVVQFPRRFTKSGETATQVTLTPDPGTVTQEGTPVNAALMNKIEQGIYDAHVLIDTKSSLAVADTRNDNPSPSDPSLDKKFMVEFKTRSVIGLPAGTGVYAAVYTFKAWSDDSGGKAHQLAYTDEGQIYYRNGSESGGWGSWYKLWHSNSDGAGSGLDADLLDGLNSGNASGNIPISNGTKNTNLNADLVDGYHAGNASGNVPVSNGTLNTNLNADEVDGIHFRVNNGALEYDSGGGFTPVGGIKSVQRGSATLSGADGSPVNVTISAVNLSKAFVTVANYAQGGSNSKQAFARLTSSTNLQFTHNAAGVTLYWEVVEGY